MAQAVRLEPSYDPEYNPELFKDSGGHPLKRWLGNLPINRRKKPYRGIAKQGEIALVPLLDNLVATADRSRNWSRWQYDSSGRLRVMTPFFEVPEIDKSPDRVSRLHIALPDPTGPQPIIHIERTESEKNGSGLYVGQEIVWSRGVARPPMMGMPGTPEGYMHLHPGNTYYEHAVKTIVAAHAEFCRV